MISFLFLKQVPYMRSMMIILKNNSLYLIYRLCFVDCINYNNFKKMVKPISSAGKSINQDNVIKNNNFINQLKQLNELYKSGVLTKEEFEKAKKRILN